MKDEWINLFAVHMPEAVDAPLLKILHSGYIGQGKMVDEFESLLSLYLGTKNVLTLNSGTSALHLALRLAGITDSSEVISTPMTCSATNVPILANHGTIVWADVDPSTGLIDPQDVERKITPKTKAIIGVDWGGTPCDWDELMRIGRKYDVKVIEDAAHAFGARYKGRKVGTVADLTCFSFQAIKHITTIDGGLLTCKDTKDYRRGKLLRWYGIDRETDKKDSRIEEDITEWGYKFHMNDVSAIIGIVQLRFIEEILLKHRDNAIDYRVRISSRYQHPYQSETDSSYWLYTLVLPDPSQRQPFIDFLKARGIQASPVHARNDIHSTFADFKRTLPGVESFSSREVAIPVHWKLTKGERQRIVDACNEFAKTL